MAAILDLPEVRGRVHRWTVPDYVLLTQDNPAFRHSELIRGLIVEKMSKSPLHMSLTAKVCEELRRRASAGLTVRQEGPLWLMDSMPEPDAAVVLGTWKDFLTHHPTTAELAVEVAVSSVALDRENASLYAEAGVGEYWIVLAETGEIEAYRQPESGVYQEKRLFRRGEFIPCACVAGGMVPVDALFA